jgi:hypothetical protein
MVLPNITTLTAGEIAKRAKKKFRVLSSTRQVTYHWMWEDIAERKS